MSKKSKLKTGEKVLFIFTGVFIVLAGIGYIILESVRLSADKPMFELKTHFNFNEEGRKGSAVFRTSRCTSCHRAMNNGTNMGLSLDGIGSKRTEQWILDFMLTPERMYEARTFDHGLAPKEAAYVAKLPKENLLVIAAFLSQLRSEPGSSSAPVPPPGRSPFIDSMIKTWAPDEWKEKYVDVREKNPELYGGLKSSDSQNNDSQNNDLENNDSAIK
ncbi:MAG: cytochrome c [Gammaproteobacteria bacterium]|nr:cytochrome c [Gammaproteobacteria bacterium]